MWVSASTGLFLSAHSQAKGSESRQRKHEEVRKFHRRLRTLPAFTSINLALTLPSSNLPVASHFIQNKIQTPTTAMGPCMICLPLQLSASALTPADHQPVSSPCCSLCLECFSPSPLHMGIPFHPRRLSSNAIS